MSFFNYDGIRFHLIDNAKGIPFVFEHGLGGEISQTLEVYEDQPGIRFVSFDFRGHGETYPLGDPAKLNFNTCAEDLLALMDHLGLPKAIVGGVSLGAGVAFNFALRFPSRVLGLIISRPAWLNKPMPNNLRIITRIGMMIQQYGSQKGLEIFKRSREYSLLRINAPSVADSLVGQFAGKRAEETAIKLVRIPNDAPNRVRAEWGTITVPTLVFATRMDPVHPYEYGKVLSQAIQGSKFIELTPKSINKELHNKESKAYIGTFLRTLNLEKK